MVRTNCVRPVFLLRACVQLPAAKHRPTGDLCLAAASAPPICGFARYISRWGRSLALAWLAPAASLFCAQAPFSGTVHVLGYFSRNASVFPENNFTATMLVSSGNAFRWVSPLLAGFIQLLVFQLYFRIIIQMPAYREFCAKYLFLKTGPLNRGTYSKKVLTLEKIS